MDWGCIGNGFVFVRPVYRDHVVYANYRSACTCYILNNGNYTNEGYERIYALRSLFRFSPTNSVHRHYRREKRVDLRSSDRLNRYTYYYYCKIKPLANYITRGMTNRRKLFPRRARHNNITIYIYITIIYYYSLAINYVIQGGALRRPV